MFYLISLVALLGFAIAPYLIFVTAPMEETMGFIQRIFYFHVPCAWVMLLSTILCGISSACYLMGKGRRTDSISIATSELTVLFGTMVLISGPLWGKIAWGKYWVWDARLTTLFILFLTFLAVLLAHHFAGAIGQRIAAGLALFGAANVPLVYLSVQLWNTQHPNNTVVRSLDPGMRPPFYVSLVCFSLLFAILLWLRVRIAETQKRVNELFQSCA